MEKIAYEIPSFTIFDEDAVLAIEALAKCSGCGGKCHRGSN